MRLSSCLMSIVLVFATIQVQADVHLPQVFSSNMVLQRDMPIKIWGWADKRESFKVKFNGQSYDVKADRKGNWEVTLDALPAGGPYDLEIVDDKSILLENILIGDVWICSGQSNMEWPLNVTNDAEEEIAVATIPRMRLFTVQKKVSTIPLEDCISDGWKVCSPETVPNFSAVAYYFGKKLNQDLDIPIGLIHTSWGGTNVETWTSATAVERVEGFVGVADELKTFDEQAAVDAQRAKLEAVTGPLPTTDEGLQEGKALWADPNMDFSSWNEMELPRLWESAGLTDLDGIVWFQRTFELESSDIEKGITVSLGAIDDSDITYLNGAEIGHMTQQYNVARKYIVDAGLLKTGKNTLVVRVEDTGGGGGIYGSPADMFVQSGDKKISLSGSWKYKVGKADFSAALGPNSMPALLYNAMIHPLIQFRIKGAIWYQGESNAGRAYQYRASFPNMIQDWRERWDQEDFPFFFVQLANFMESATEPEESAWAELREAQSMTLSLPNTGMATIIDIGEANDIHPRNKRDVGRRLALNALNITYGKNVVYSGPTFKSMQIEGAQAIISMDNIGSGYYLKDKYGYVNGFAVCGEDRKFYWAKAEIVKDKIHVYSEKVKSPVAVRYGWANNPDDLNLFNLEGLPAVPFRTDDFPGVTINATYR